MIVAVFLGFGAQFPELWRKKPRPGERETNGVRLVYWNVRMGRYQQPIQETQRE